jgi:hypothetical protein
VCARTVGRARRVVQSRKLAEAAAGGQWWAIDQSGNIWGAVARTIKIIDIAAHRRPVRAQTRPQCPVRALTTGPGGRVSG